MTTLLERLEELMAELESGGLNYAEDAEAKDEIIDHAPDLLKAVRALQKVERWLGKLTTTSDATKKKLKNIRAALAPFMEQKP